MKTIIISGGSLDHKFAAAFLSKEKQDCLLAADKGMEFCYEQKICPDYIMGDFDSADPKIVSYYSNSADVELIRFQPEKDDTDMELAVRKAITLGSDKIYVLGALGGRMDHCIANIHLLKQAAEADVEMHLIDPQNDICLVQDGKIIKKEEQYGKYVSFLPFTDQVTGITLSGFKYPLEDYSMSRGTSIGVSNEVQKDVAEVRVKTGILIMIQSKDC